MRLRPSDAEGVLISQKGKQFMLSRMEVEPRPDPLNLGVILKAELGRIDLLHAPSRLFFNGLCLPGSRQDRVNIVVKVSLL